MSGRCVNGTRHTMAKEGGLERDEQGRYLCPVCLAPLCMSASQTGGFLCTKTAGHKGPHENIYSTALGDKGPW